MKYSKDRPLLRWHDSKWFGVSTPTYEESLVAQLKEIPIRAWDAGAKTWWYPAGYLQMVENLVRPYFPRAFTSLLSRRDQPVPDGPTWGAPPENPGHGVSAGGSIGGLGLGPAFVRKMMGVRDPYEILCVTKDAPDSVVSAALGAMTEEFGENEERSAELRDAFNQIRRERGM